MYPHDVFNLFPPFPRDERVFVAMSFDKRCDYRWENVIVPAINEVGLCLIESIRKRSVILS
jgi:hypothetical protein